MFFGTPHQITANGPSAEELIFEIAVSLSKKNRGLRREIVTSVIKAGVDACVEISESFLILAGQYKIVDIYESNELGDSVVGFLCLSGHNSTRSPVCECHPTTHARVTNATFLIVGLETR